MTDPTSLFDNADREALAELRAYLLGRPQPDPSTGSAAALRRVRAVLEMEAVVGRTALEYRGLILAALTADDAQQAAQPTPCSQPNPCEDGELCATHEEEQAHADGEHQYCGITCETQMPSAPMYNSIVAHGIPGTRGMLDELLRRAAAGLLPTAEERQPAPDVVAFRNPDKPSTLWCCEHGQQWWGLTPITSEDLPDGGVCGQCHVDVLIPQGAGRG